MYPGEIWSCYHTTNTPDKKYKPIIVVEIIDDLKAFVVINTYDNYYNGKLDIKNLVFDYRFK